jgi:hypothetical protein
MGRDWDQEERLFDERFFLDEETLTCAQTYLVKHADETKEGEELTWWYECGFHLSDGSGSSFSLDHGWDDDKERILPIVREKAEKVASSLSRLISAIDQEVERKPEEVLGGGAEPTRERDSD